MLLQISKLLVLASAARTEGKEDWECFVVEALQVAYRRGLVCVKEQPLQLLLCWLCCPILTKLNYSEKAFKSAAMLDSLNHDNPETPTLLAMHKNFLLDEECATYSRLTVLIAEKEKEVAANQAAKKDGESSQDSLNAARNDKDILEKKRIAFPNPLIMFCKLQSMVQSFKEKESITPEQLAEWEHDVNAFRLKLQK